MKGVNLRSMNKYEPALFQGGMKSHSSVNASGNLIESRCDFFSLGNLIWYLKLSYVASC